MTDSERQEELEQTPEAEEAHVPPLHGEPDENPEELEEHLEDVGEEPADEDKSPVEAEVALEAQGDTFDPDEMEEARTERQAVEEAAEDAAMNLVGEAQAQGLTDIPETAAEGAEQAAPAEAGEPEDETTTVDLDAVSSDVEADGKEAAAQESVDAAISGAEVESVDEVREEPAAAAELETVEPETAEPEMAEPEMAEPEAAEPEPEDGRSWFVVHCYSGQENKVRHNLEQRIESMGMKDRIFDVVVPTEEEIEVKDGKRRTVERRVFPGYILVQMVLDEDSWYVVRNTPGVTGFVGMGNEPTPLRPEEVSQIIKRMEAEAPRIKVTYKIGQKVRIIDGPFNDFIGTVDDIDMERAKVRVMVSFFGRETPVELDFLQVEKA